MDLKPQFILDLESYSRQNIHFILDEMAGSLETVRVSLPLLIMYGADLLKEISNKNYSIFLDVKNGKYQEIEAIAQTLQPYNIRFVSINLSGGLAIIQNALKAQEKYLPKTILVGSNLLSLSTSEELQYLGYYETNGTDLLYQWTDLAIDCGINTFRCHEHELIPLRTIYGENLTLISEPQSQENEQILNKSSFWIIKVPPQYITENKMDFQNLIEHTYSSYNS